MLTALGDAFNKRGNTCLKPTTGPQGESRTGPPCPQVPEVLQVPLVVLETQVSEAPRVLLDTVTHPSVPASHTMDKAIQVCCCHYKDPNSTELKKPVWK